MKVVMAFQTILEIPSGFYGLKNMRKKNFSSFRRNSWSSENILKLLKTFEALKKSFKLAKEAIKKF